MHIQFSTINIINNIANISVYIVNWKPCPYLENKLEFPWSLWMRDVVYCNEWHKLSFTEHCFQVWIWLANSNTNRKWIMIFRRVFLHMIQCQLHHTYQEYLVRMDDNIVIKLTVCVATSLLDYFQPFLQHFIPVYFIVIDWWWICKHDWIFVKRQLSFF